jgi:CO dehydrogenase maturation factor
VDQGGSGCACPENVLIRALVTDLVLVKDDVLVMDMEAGVEHLGRATARGVETMMVVIEPGQRSIDCAKRITRMSNEIGLQNIQLVANKVDGPKDEQFIRNAFPDHDLLGMIPYSEEIRRNDRNGLSVLDGLSEEMVKRLEGILRNLNNLIINDK